MRFGAHSCPFVVRSYEYNAFGLQTAKYKRSTCRVDEVKGLYRYFRSLLIPLTLAIQAYSIMKFVTAVGLFALAVDAGVIKRQEGLGDLASLIPKGFDLGKIAKSMPKGGLAALFSPEVRKAYKVEDIKPKRNPEAKRVRITYGPYKVKAANVSSVLGSLPDPLVDSDREKKLLAIVFPWVRIWWTYL